MRGSAGCVGSKLIKGLVRSVDRLRVAAIGVTALAVLSCAHTSPRATPSATQVARPIGRSTETAATTAENPATVGSVAGNQVAAGRNAVPPGPAVAVEQVLSRRDKLALADVVDIALRNNPSTRAAWADARAAAAYYRSSKGAWLPKVNLSGGVARSKVAPSPGRAVEPVTSYNAAASLSYLLFDFGGRSASVEESRQAFLAEDWTRNAVIQSTVLQAEVAFFNYAGAKAMLEANRTSLADAQANLAAAEERQRVGLATSADVLQARTAYSEVKLAVIGTEGQVRTTRATLAVWMGYPANVFPELDVSIPDVPGYEISATVDELAAAALASRPDLQASRAVSLESGARVRQAWSSMLPSVSASGSVGRTWLRDRPGFTETYSGALLLQIPLFTGFSQQFDLVGARAQAEAARERTRADEQATIFEVVSAHSDFITAGERLKTAGDLFASAKQSEEVALGRYKEGVGSILDLLSAQRALATARAEQINARLGWFVALAQLAHDVGVLGADGDTPLAPGALVPR